MMSSSTRADGAHDKGDPDHVVELLEHGHGVLPAVAEVAAHGVAQPSKEAQHNVLVQTILGIELRDPLFIGLCARCHGQLLCHVLHIGGRKTAQQRIDNKGDKE